MTEIDWEDVAKTLDKQLTKTIDALIQAATTSEPNGVTWDQWQRLTNHRLPEWTARKQPV